MKNKVNVLGIIAEYNPIHNGHIFQLKKCKEESKAEFTVAVMSGNFTQRGEPALLDKWIRAEMAVLAGVDLIIELPFYFACNSAEYFAKGAINILNDLGIVTHLGFGSESGDIKRISEVSQKLIDEEEEIIHEIKGYLADGISFPKARELTLKGYEDILREPNNILGIEYVKELKRLQSSIIPITIKRFQAGYHQEELVDNNVGSGTAIRKKLQTQICENADIPVLDEVKELLSKHREEFVFYDNEKFFELLKYKILNTDSKELSKIFSVGEGLENRIKNEIRKASNLDTFLERVKSKRYTRTRIQRICAHIVLEMEKETIVERYVRVLAFNEKGAQLLKKIKKEGNENLHIVTNVTKNKDVDFSLDIKATDVYNLISQKDTYYNSDFVKGPVIINN